MAESIIPASLPVTLKRADAPALAKEWAWDFENYRFARNKSGQMYQVTGEDAVKTWIWKLFKTRRWHEIVHTDAYGTDVWSLVGKGYSRGFTESEAARIVREALELNLSKYIKHIGTIKVAQRHGRLNIEIPITTIYSDTEEVVEVEA